MNVPRFLEICKRLGLDPDTDVLGFRRVGDEWFIKLSHEARALDLDVRVPGPDLIHVERPDGTTVSLRRPEPDIPSQRT